MRTPFPVIILALLLVGCSFHHEVRVENVGEEPVTIVYKIRPAPWVHGLFAPRPVVWHRSGKAMVLDTTCLVNPADSIVSFTLGPGDEALLGSCMNCTLEVLTTHEGSDPWMDNEGNSRLNLYWMRIEHAGKSTTYSPKELVALAAKNKLQRTLLRLKS